MVSISIKSDVNIKASADEVFIYLINLKYLSLWNPSLKKISKRNVLTEGASYKAEILIFNKYPVKSQNHITKLVANKLIVAENEFGLVHYKSTIKLSKLKGGTKVEHSIDILTKPMLFGLTADVLRNLANHEINADLEALKTVIENKIK